MAFSYTNRKGKRYFLHARTTKTGKTRYVFARSIGDGAIEAIPEGYEVSESINGQVSLATRKPRVVPESEEAEVIDRLMALRLGWYRVETRADAVVVYEPIGGSYQPVLRFVLDDDQRRVFHVERMTYRGHGGWSWPLGSGRLSALAKKYLPHLGKESFFELM